MPGSQDNGCSRLALKQEEAYLTRVWGRNPSASPWCCVELLYAYLEHLLTEYPKKVLRKDHGDFSLEMKLVRDCFG